MNAMKSRFFIIFSSIFLGILLLTAYAVTPEEIEEPSPPTPIIGTEKEYGFKFTQSKEYLLPQDKNVRSKDLRKEVISYQGLAQKMRVSYASKNAPFGFVPFSEASFMTSLGSVSEQNTEIKTGLSKEITKDMNYEVYVSGRNEGLGGELISYPTVGFQFNIKF
jgi:hypothetical protein